MANISDSRSKRTFHVLRLAILNALSIGRQTINQIAVKAGINWRTVELHLTYLSGKGYVREIYSSQYVRIFIITDKGAEALKTGVEKLRANIEVYEENGDNSDVAVGIGEIIKSESR